MATPLKGVPELLDRTCPSCGQTYQLPWLVTDFGDGNCQIEQLIEDARVHDCNDRLVKLATTREQLPEPWMWWH